MSQTQINVVFAPCHHCRNQFLNPCKTLALYQSPYFSLSLSLVLDLTHKQSKSNANRRAIMASELWSIFEYYLLLHFRLISFIYVQAHPLFLRFLLPFFPFGFWETWYSSSAMWCRPKTCTVKIGFDFHSWLRILSSCHWRLQRRYSIRKD
jgi:hypothetical protein